MSCLCEVSAASLLLLQYSIYTPQFAKFLLFGSTTTTHSSNCSIAIPRIKLGARRLTVASLGLIGRLRLCPGGDLQSSRNQWKDRLMKDAVSKRG